MSPDSKTRYLDITCMYNESIIYANIYISSNELLASDSHDWLLNCVTSSQNGFCAVARVSQVRGECTVPEHLLILIPFETLTKHSATSNKLSVVWCWVILSLFWRQFVAVTWHCDNPSKVSFVSWHFVTLWHLSTNKQAEIKTEM